MAVKKDYYVLYAAYVKWLEYIDDEDEYEIVLVVVEDEENDNGEDILIELHLPREELEKLCLKIQEKEEKCGVTRA